MSEIEWDDLNGLKQSRPALVLETLSDGDVAGFRRALEEGFDVNRESDYGGTLRTPAHHAAAAGDTESLKLLVEHGAALDAVDPTHHATPRGWAEFFDQADAAEYLRALE